MVFWLEESKQNSPGRDRERERADENEEELSEERKRGEINAAEFVCRREIDVIRATSYIRGVTMSFIMFTTRMSLFITVLVYVLLDNKITAEKVFMVTAYYNILRTTMTVFFPQGTFSALIFSFSLHLSRFSPPHFYPIFIQFVLYILHLLVFSLLLYFLSFSLPFVAQINLPSRLASTNLSC